VTDAIKQRTFTREIIRRIVSRNGLYSKRENHSRFTLDTGNHSFLIILFDIVDNFDILLGRTVIGKSFHRVILVIGVRIVLKPDT